MFTIQHSLNTATQNLATISESPRLDAEVLLAFVLGKNRSYLRAWNDKILNEQEILQFESLLSQRQQGVPIAYLTGTREFWSRDFFVSPDVLIPRPDTEILIEHCLEMIPQDLPFQILDLGTGSGIIAITLACERPNAKIIAVDASESALKVAQKNAAFHNCQNIEFILSDWFSNVPQRKFDLIVSNPPYICENDEHLTQGDVRFEPKSALVAAENGLRDIFDITKNAKNYLTSNGQLLFEHGYNQAKDVQTILGNLGFVNVQTHHDLAGQPRITAGFLPSF
ncbi:MAG: peptide chain release factor N(5)-glutamine methyltransferase [Methylococcales bacterium]|nr:peptide chain release factor N(5)-glutamine methyltransferase [Methylococcales bacterium]